MIKLDNEEFEVKVDERTKTMTATMRRFVDEKHKVEVIETVTGKEQGQWLVDAMKKDRDALTADLKRRRELIDNLVKKKKDIVQDLKKQGMKIEATLNPELQELKNKLEILTNWDEVYGKTDREIELQKKTIEEGEKRLEFQKQKLGAIRGLSKSLDLDL